MCVSCGKLMGVERVCPYCGADSRAVVARVRTLAKGAGSGHVVTSGLVLLNLALFALAVLLGGSEPAEGGLEILRPDGGVMLRLGLQHPELVAMGEWWRLIMPVFLHLGLLHLVMNTLVLWLTGRSLERDIGGPAFFTLYMTAGIVGFVASQFADIGGGGASGAVAGLLGATIVYRRLSDGSFSHPVTQMAIQLVVINAIFGIAVSKVNNVAHLAGFLSGAALGLPLAMFEGKRIAGRMWWGFAGVLGAVTVAALVMTILHQPPAWRGEVQRAKLCHGQAREAADLENQTVTPGPALQAIRCLEKIGPMDETGDRWVGLIRSGLVKARSGRLDGSRKAEVDGVAMLFDGLLGFKRWAEADPRLDMP